MKWVIKNRKSGLYFKGFGSGNNEDSFTAEVEKAKLFPNRCEARLNLESGETAVSYEKELLLKRAPVAQEKRPVVALLSSTFNKDGDDFDGTLIDIQLDGQRLRHDARILIYGTELDNGAKISGRALAEDIVAYLNSSEFAAKKIV